MYFMLKFYFLIMFYVILRVPGKKHGHKWAITFALEISYFSAKLMLLHFFRLSNKHGFSLFEVF